MKIPAPIVAIFLLVSISGASSAKTINGTSKNDKLKGTPKADVFYGQSGNDRMIGGESVLGIGGKDKADGGKGNDIYEIFGEPGEFKIIERKNSGNDTWIPMGFVGVRKDGGNLAKLSPWLKTTKSGDQRVLMRLPDHVENLNCRVWNGAASENTPTANHLFTELHGNDLNNTMTSDDRASVPDGWIHGTYSHDRIYGYGGDDTFRFGMGRDAYFGGEGWDTLDLRLAKVSVLINAEPEFFVNLPNKYMIYGAIRNNTWTGDQITLDSIECVILSRGVDHVKGTGNGDTFIMDRGDRAGGDKIWAGEGNDLFVVKRDFNGYQAVTYFGETGFDTLDLSDFQLPVTLDLGSVDSQPVPNPDGGTWLGFKVLSVEAVYSGIRDDVLSGHSAVTEIFRPGRGNDIIKGDNTIGALYTNVDYIYFDTPLDAVNNVDTILDVKTETDNSKRLEDILYLDHRIFKNILTSAPGGAAYLAAGRFKRIGTGGSAVDADDRILVDQELGEIYYDADGSGSLSPVLFAKFMPGINVGAANFATY